MSRGRPHLEPAAEAAAGEVVAEKADGADQVEQRLFAHPLGKRRELGLKASHGADRAAERKGAGWGCSAVTARSGHRVATQLAALAADMLAKAETAAYHGSKAGPVPDGSGAAAAHASHRPSFNSWSVMRRPREELLRWRAAPVWCRPGSPSTRCCVCHRQHCRSETLLATLSTAPL